MQNDTTQFRIAVMGIIVSEEVSTQRLNTILSDYSKFIFGRMGVPHREQKVNVLSVALYAPQNIMNALAGKIGKLDGISVKVTYAPMPKKED